MSTSEQAQLTKKISPLYHTLKGFLSITLKEERTVNAMSLEFVIQDWQLLRGFDHSPHTNCTLLLLMYAVECLIQGYYAHVCIIPSFNYVELMLCRRLLDVEFHLWLKRPGRRFSRTACEDSTRPGTPLKYVFKAWTCCLDSIFESVIVIWEAMTLKVWIC